jgi:hypothetical protein
MQENRALPFTSGSTPARSQREDENRVHIAIPVKVYPDIRSVESHTCCTYEISVKGARLVAPPGIREVGQEIWLQRQNRRARYKVAWIGAAGTAQASQVGVESLEPGNVIWENEIRARLMGR